MESLCYTKQESVESCNSLGYTKLQSTVRQNRVDLVTTLLHKGADVNFTGKKGHKTALHFACCLENSQMAEILLEARADPNIPDKHGQTLPLEAVRKFNTIELLLNKGADVNKTDTCGRTPLHEAVFQKNIHMIEILLNKGADLNKRTKSGRTPLYVAVEINNIEAVKILIENGADTNLTDNYGKSPLVLALEMDHTDVAQMLLDNRAEMSAEVEQYLSKQVCENRLHYCCKHGEVIISLDKGESINIRDENGCTPLHIASIYGHFQVFKLLIERGADILCKNSNGQTALQLAYKNHHQSLVELIVDNFQE